MADKREREWLTRVRTYRKNVRSADVPCPKCRKRQSLVLDCRGTASGAIRRRRACACGYRFTTAENYVAGPSKNGVAAMLNRIELLLEDLRDAVEHADADDSLVPKTQDIA